jgi:uncharacterized membrane protein YeiH
MPSPEFMLPLYLDLIAVMVMAYSGAVAGLRRRYDIVGVAALALVTSLGGALIRDGFFLQQGLSPILTDYRYLLAVGLGVLAVIPTYSLANRLQTPMLLFDAVGLALYTVVGAQKAILAGVPIPGAVLIGVSNGVGGSILRDVLTRHEPLLFKPGQYYAATSFIGALVYTALAQLQVPRPIPSISGVALILTLRVAAIYFDLRTTPIAPLTPKP